MKYFKELNEQVMNIWYDMPSTYENFKFRYDRRKDKALVRLNKTISRELRSMTSFDLDAPKTDKLLLEIKDFAINTLEMSSHAVDDVFKEEHFEPSQGFIKRAKELVPDLSRENLFQALRNVWVLHTMQMYLNKPVVLTDAAFAYSMLYPLTDNYLDNPKISKKDKFEFNQRFRHKILTGEGVGRDQDESRVFLMIDIIESDWPRKEYPKVYHALAAILDGQNDSLYQQNMESLFHKDLLSITFYKGGSSVLADAYLVGGDLTETEELFAFLYGVILQMADDIQDIDQDLKEQHYTMMNVQGTLGHLDIILGKLLHLIDNFLEEHYEQSTSQQQSLRELTKESVQLLVFEALMKSKKYVSKDMLKSIKEGSHFSKYTYRKVERSMNKHLNGLIEGAIG